MKGFVDKFNFYISLRTQVLLDLFLSLIPHVVFHTEIQTQLFVFFIDIVRKVINLDILHFF